MKAISLWQPWATLIAIGAKTIETRGWGTDYRGPLIIHAAKKWNGELRQLCHTEPFKRALAGVAVNTPPLGSLVATCRIVRCYQILHSQPRVYSDRPGLMLPPLQPERSFGDYSVGRYAWVLADVKPLPLPIPYSGSQGWMEIDPDVLGAEQEPVPSEPSLFPDATPTVRFK